MNNYEFCARWVLDQGQGKDLAVLDYGCGGARIVLSLRESGVNAFGCDVFYGGGNTKANMDPELFERAIVREINDGKIPFENGEFDIIINNQVMEHVEDLDSVLAEIARVLKPGGVVLSLFPDKGTWREGHCGVPFLHRWPKGGRLRVYYAAAWRSLGFGHFKQDKSVMRWSRDFCDWLDRWTHYRSRAEISMAYEKHFFDTRHVEDIWLQQRLGRRRKFVAWLPRAVQRLVARKLGSLVFVARKPA